MKVIGTGHSGKYLCEVDHTELEKFLGQYYGNMKRLKIGDHVDLSRGYDFADEARAACKATEEFIKNNSKMIRAIMDGITILGAKDKP